MILSDVRHKGAVGVPVSGSQDAVPGFFGEASPEIQRHPGSPKMSSNSEEWRGTMSDLCENPRKPLVKQ